MGSSRLPISLTSITSQKRVQKANLTAFLNVDLYHLLQPSPFHAQQTNENRLRNLVFFFFLLRWTRKAALQVKGRGILGSISDAYRNIRRTLYGLFLRSPGVRSKVQKSVTDSLAKLEGKLIPRGPGVTYYLTLPKEGWSESQVSAELEKLEQMEHTRWEDGLVSGAVYHGGRDLLKLQSEAFNKFGVANPIHPDVFPGVRKMEAEVVAMVLSMFNAPQGAAGATTSGGTESILLACLSARQKAYHERGVTEPEMYVCLYNFKLDSNLLAGSYQRPPTPLSAKPVNTSISKSTSSTAQHQRTKSISPPLRAS